MSLRARLVAVAALAFVAPACATAPPSLRGDWTLAGMNGAVPRGQATLRLENGRLSGRSFCNYYSGPYQIRSDRLLVGQIAATRLFCGGGDGGFDRMAAERAFLDALSAEPRLQLGPEGLLLEAGNGSTLTFRRAGSR